MLNRNVEFGICEWSVPQSDIGSIALVSAMGYSGMVLDLGKKEDEFPISKKEVQETYIEKAKLHNITYTTMAVNELCRIGMIEKENYKTITEIFDTLVIAAADLSIPLLQIPSFVKGFIKTEEDLINTAKCLKYLCKVANEKGIVVGTENGLDGENNLRLLDMVDEKNLKIYFDTANPLWLADGLDAPKILKEIKDHLCEVHVKDVGEKEADGSRSFKPLGTGAVKLEESVRILKEIGYKGWIHNENSYEVSLLENDIKYLRNAFND